MLRDLAIALGIVALVAAFASWDPDTGVRSWWRLRGDHAAAEQRIAELQHHIELLRLEAAALRGDPLAQERAIREDLGLARAGETVLRLRSRERSLPSR